VVATTPTIKPIVVAPQQSSAQLQPAKITLPITTPDGETHASIRATADSAIHEISTVLSEILAIPASLLPSEAVSMTSAPNADSKRSPRPAPHAHAAQGRSSGSPGIQVWSYAAPVLTGLCVYILAPLMVDLLKQRIQIVRRDVNAAKAA
jgi:hypothetical protein